MHTHSFLGLILIDQMYRLLRIETEYLCCMRIFRDSHMQLSYSVLDVFDEENIT